MDLHHGDEGGIEVVGFGLLCVQNLNWECSARNSEDRTPIEVLGKLLGIECGRGDDKLQVGSLLACLCGVCVI
jgi:hypothetical protein